jgi:hypothetical protein
MTLFMLIFALTAIAMALMATGLLLSRQPLKRGCAIAAEGPDACSCDSDRRRRCAAIRAALRSSQ